MASSTTWVYGRDKTGKRVNHEDSCLYPDVCTCFSRARVKAEVKSVTKKPVRKSRAKKK